MSWNTALEHRLGTPAWNAARRPLCSSTPSACRKRAYRKLRQARRALFGLDGRRFKVARGLLGQCLKLLKLQDSDLARRAGRRAVRALDPRS